LKPEWWGSQLFQGEKYQGENICDERRNNNDDNNNNNNNNNTSSNQLYAALRLEALTFPEIINFPS